VADTKRPLEVFDDRADAEQAAKETWRPQAAKWGFDVEVRAVQSRVRMNVQAGHYVTLGPWGVYLKERNQGGGGNGR
jgi:hypothetical protein